MTVCNHAPSPNPRMEGVCVKCGRPVTPQIRRDRAFECEITRQIAGGLKVDVEPLNLLAGKRADNGQYDYGYDFPDLERSMEQETLEELADARNYLVWRLDAIHRGLDDSQWRVEHLQRALRHVALAFEEVRAAR